VQVKISRNNQNRKRNAQRSRAYSSIRIASEMKLPGEINRSVGMYYANTAPGFYVTEMDLIFLIRLIFRKLWAL